jgi:hypothetical protein
MELVNFVGLDQAGPTYQSVLNYVGRLSKSRGSIEPSGLQGSKEPGPAIADWLSQVKANPGVMKNLAAAAGESTGDDYYLFAAHFSLDYFTPDRQHREGLRPFGKVLFSRSGQPAEYYRIGIRNIRSAPSSGLAQSKITAPGLGSPEYELHFRAPAPKEAPFAFLSESGYHKWVEEKAKARDPNVDLVKEKD